MKRSEMQLKVKYSNEALKQTYISLSVTESWLAVTLTREYAKIISTLRVSGSFVYWQSPISYLEQSGSFEFLPWPPDSLLSPLF